MTKKEKKELEVSAKKEINSAAGEPIRHDISYVPDVDIAESPDAITLYADTPAARKEDVDIDIREGVLTITAPVDDSVQQKNCIHQEYGIGGFQRRFNLGEGIDQESISASLENGVLTLRLPKAAAHKPRKIEIRS
jgi:HSP20 family molecular chaperone IbpA